MNKERRFELSNEEWKGCTTAPNRYIAIRTRLYSSGNFREKNTNLHKTEAPICFVLFLLSLVEGKKPLFFSCKYYPRKIKLSLHLGRFARGMDLMTLYGVSFLFHFIIHNGQSFHRLRKSTMEILENLLSYMH